MAARAVRPRPGGRLRGTVRRRGTPGGAVGVGVLRWVVHRAPALVGSLAADEGTEGHFAEPVLRPRLLLPDGAVPPDPRYLAWHREHVFRAA